MCGCVTVVGVDALPGAAQIHIGHGSPKNNSMNYRKGTSPSLRWPTHAGDRGRDSCSEAKWGKKCRERSAGANKGVWSGARECLSWTDGGVCVSSLLYTRI